MYYIDSAVKKVYSLDYNITEGTIANQKPFVDYAQDDKLGLPDGMCTDVDGKVNRSYIIIVHVLGSVHTHTSSIVTVITAFM